MTENKTLELFILAYVNDEGEVIGFPKDGGSSTKPPIEAHDNCDSVKRSKRFFLDYKVVRVLNFERID